MRSWYGTCVYGAWMRTPWRDDFVQRASGAHEIVIHLAGADLIPCQRPLFQFGVEVLVGPVGVCASILISSETSLASILRLTGWSPTTIVARTGRNS